jgi:hypothetical protein
VERVLNMQKSRPSQIGSIRLLDAIVWLWLVVSLIFLAGWRSSLGTLIAVGSGLLLVVASLWLYRNAGGTWLRLFFGLVFLLGVIWVAVRW